MYVWMWGCVLVSVCQPCDELTTCWACTLPLNKHSTMFSSWLANKKTLPDNNLVNVIVKSVQQSCSTPWRSNLLANTAWLTTWLSQLETSTQLKDYLTTIRYLEYGTAWEAYGCNLWHPSLYGIHLLLIKLRVIPQALCNDPANDS